MKLKRFIKKAVATLVALWVFMIVVPVYGEEMNSRGTDMQDTVSENSMDFVLTPRSGILDITAPVINEIQLSTASVEAGGSIEITADITDDISGVDYVWMSFQCEEYPQTLDVNLSYNGYYDNERNEQKEFNDGKWHGIIYINQYARPGDYTVSSVSMRDKAGNYSYEISDSIRNVKFTVTNGGTIDITAPVINEIQLSTASVEAGGSIEITADITDDISGVDYVWMSFQCEEYPQTLDVNLSYNGYYDNERNEQKEFNDGKWHGIIYINQYARPGDYTVSSVSMRDKAGNYSYEISGSVRNVKFTVINSGIIDTTAPVIKEIMFEKSSVDAPGYFEVVADITDDISGVRYVQISLKNSVYDHTQYLHLYNSYYDIVSGQEVEYSDGKWHGEMHINQYGRPGDYVVSNVYIEDNAGNVNYEVPDEFNNLKFTVLNDGTGVATITGTDSSDYIQKISGAPDDAVILVDYSNNSNIQADVFNAIKGTNKQVVFESDGYQWIVNGKDITEETKDVNLSIHTYALINGYSGADKALEDVIGDMPAMVFDFAENGILPGKMTVRIKAAYALREYVGITGIYVYYYDTSTGKLEPIALDISLTDDYYFEFSIEHCSEYILTQGAIQETSINLTDGNQNSIGNSNSNANSTVNDNVVNSGNDNRNTVSGANINQNTENVAPGQNVSQAPKTGDDFRLNLVLWIFFISLTGMAVIFGAMVYRKYTQEKIQ